VECFRKLDHFDVSFNLIESPPSYILETCSVPAIFSWLSKWQLAHHTRILNFSASNLLEVPLEFASLNSKSLTEINFSSNQIAMIPDTLSRFHFLTTLLLNNNNLQFIPNTVFLLSRLQTLEIQGNYITGDCSNHVCFQFLPHS
jgi:hypothetical protein